MSLDDRLEQNIAIRGFESVNGDGEYFGNLDENSVEVIKQAILTDLLGIIGEEKHDKGFMRPAPEYGPGYSVGRPKCEALDGDECTCGADIANSTRDKIREKIKAYCE